jgi:hypothetical protein
MKYLHVHVGRNKTGSTSLQMFLLKNKENLLKSDFEYSSLDKYNNYNPLFSQLSNKAIRSSSKKNISKLITDIKLTLDNNIKLDRNVIISAEALSNVSPTIFNEIFSNFPIKIIAYVRNELDYLSSNYQQAIKSQAIGISFSNWLTKNRIDIALNNSFILKLKQMSFKDLQIRKYSRNALYNSDIRYDFLLNVLGLNNFEDYKFLANSNISISSEVIEFKRQLYNKNIDDFEGKNNIHLFTSLSKDYINKFRIPKSEKNKILQILNKTQTEWYEEFGFGFNSNEYIDYEFSNNRPQKINFESMLKKIKKLKSNS